MALEINEQLINRITQLVMAEVQKLGAQDGLIEAEIGTDSDEVVIGVAPAYGSAIKHTLNGLPHDEILRQIRQGIVDEGMRHRTIKVYATSDVAFVGREAARLSGSGVSVGLQSKGTAIIHRHDLKPLSNLELFSQAPLLTLEHYRRIGRNAAKYAKGEQVTPAPAENDPMLRPSYQVKAALMHIKETECIDKNRHSVIWE